MLKSKRARTKASTGRDAIKVIATEALGAVTGRFAIGRPPVEQEPTPGAGGPDAPG